MSVGQVRERVDQLLLLKLMYLSREGDRREGVLLRQSKGWFHVAGIGHETMAVIAMSMNDEDYLLPYYRDRSMVLARGVTNFDLALAYFAKRDSSSAGRQMPGFYSLKSRKIWSGAAPTGCQLLPACGIAWSLQLRNEPGVVVATTGDAATRQGEFYEAVSFAVERQLPIVFVVEDNRYGISTCTDRFNPFKLGIFNEAIGVWNVDARHPQALETVAAQALAKARGGDGPSILVCELDRLCGHTSSDDHRVYRSPKEISEMMDRDPIHILAQQLIEQGALSIDQWETIQKEIEHEVDQDYRRAELEDDARPEAVLEQILGDPPTDVAPPLDGNQKLRMVDAVNTVFHDALEHDSDVVFFGQDIEDPKGGVFGLTHGLSDAYPDRVFNSPLAEATIAGVACGMASVGMRPVFEIQFVDFVAPAWNQITQNLATLRWRTGGDWTCPVVLYAPYGAYLPGGALWHSQANEAWFAHTPGLRVVIPSTPEDAAGLLSTAMAADDPTIVLLPKHLIRQQFHVGEKVPAVPFGKARIQSEGSDITIVSWGNCLDVVQRAVDQSAPGLSAEVIDLRSIQPWDKKTIQRSVAKTGRLVVVQEDSESCSVGQMIISELTGNEESWYSFSSAPQLVSKPDVHIGFNPVCEYAALPSVEKVLLAIQTVMTE